MRVLREVTPIIAIKTFSLLEYKLFTEECIMITSADLFFYKAHYFANDSTKTDRSY